MPASVHCGRRFLPRGRGAGGSAWRPSRGSARGALLDGRAWQFGTSGGLVGDVLGGLDDHREARLARAQLRPHPRLPHARPCVGRVDLHAEPREPLRVGARPHQRRLPPVLGDVRVELNGAGLVRRSGALARPLARQNPLDGRPGRGGQLHRRIGVEPGAWILPQPRKEGVEAAAAQPSLDRERTRARLFESLPLSVQADQFNSRSRSSSVTRRSMAGMATHVIPPPLDSSPRSPNRPRWPPRTLSARYTPSWSCSCERHRPQGKDDAVEVWIELDCRTRPGSRTTGPSFRGSRTRTARARHRAPVARVMASGFCFHGQIRSPTLLLRRSPRRFRRARSRKVRRARRGRAPESRSACTRHGGPGET